MAYDKLVGILSLYFPAEHLFPQQKLYLQQNKTNRQLIQSKESGARNLYMFVFSLVHAHQLNRFGFLVLKINDIVDIVNDMMKNDIVF